jgi:type II secretory pathway component PulF
MAIFEFKGRNAEGRLVIGQLDASTPDAAANQLLGRGITPVEVKALPNKSVCLKNFLAQQIAEKLSQLSSSCFAGRCIRFLVQEFLWLRVCVVYQHR